MMPKQLFDLYLRLIAQDLSEELANQIMEAVREELREAHMDDPALVRKTVMEHLAQHIPWQRIRWQSTARMIDR